MLKSIWLVIRNLLMICLFPGVVVVYLPNRILIPYRFPSLNEWSINNIVALLLIVCGATILLKCIWDFGHTGKGTLAPFDETKQLIIVGLYRYVRNPMYVGVVLILLGESWFFGATSLLIYTGFFVIILNLFVVWYEEHRLRNKYGDEYRRYCHQVRRWMPGKPYQKAD